MWEGLYTNYKGETAKRRLVPVNIFYGTSEFHEGEQWFIRGWCLDRQAFRDFALSGFKGDGEPVPEKKISGVFEVMIVHSTGAAEIRYRVGNDFNPPLAMVLFEQRVVTNEIKVEAMDLRSGTAAVFYKRVTPVHQFNRVEALAEAKEKAIEHFMTHPLPGDLWN